MSGMTAAGARGAAKPSIGLALGGGSARGLSHILMLEAIDELGLTPSRIAGTSIGAIFGACYAAGMSALEIRDFAEDLLANKLSFLKRFGKDFPDSLASLWSLKSVPLVDGVSFFEIVMPEPVHCDFASLKIPFTAIATDFYAMSERAIKHGPVIPAIAASSALPTLMRSVEIEGHALIDGGFVNPTPFDKIINGTDISIAVDVTGDTRKADGKGVPGSFEGWVGATQIMFRSITSEKLKSGAPDIFVRPEVGAFGTLDFFQLKEIFAAAAPAKDQMKRELEAALDAYASASIEGA